MYNSSYLIKSRHSIYYFRYPFEMLCGSKQRVSMSLGTRCPKQALRFARALTYHAATMMNDQNMQNLDYRDVKEILRTHFREVLERIKLSIDKDGGLPDDSARRFEEQQSYVLEAIKTGRDELYGNLFNSDADIPEELSLDSYLAPIVQSFDLSNTKDSKEYQVLRKEYKYALNGYISSLLKYNSGDGFYDLVSGDAVNQKAENTNQNDLKLKNVIAAFSEEIKPHKSAKGFKDHMGCLCYLMEVFGEDFLVSDIDYPKARKLKEMLLKTPSNRNKNPLTRGLSLEAQISLGKEKALEFISITSVNKNIGYIGALFIWAKKQKYVNENPFEGLKVRINKKTTRRDNLEMKEVSKILVALSGMRLKTAKDKTRYWGALIAIYTGARLNEVAALTSDDIKYDENSGVWYFDINNNDASKSIKTEAAKRLVPIHSRLIELGFLDYVEHARKVGQNTPERGDYKSRLLYDLTYTEDGKWGRKLGRWFNGRFLTELGIKTEKKTLHSLRHSFITSLGEAGVEGATIKYMVGHEDDAVTIQSYMHYGIGHIEIFKDAIQKLPYK